MSKQENRKFMTRGDRRGEQEAVLRYLRENLPPDVFEGLRLNSRKLTMRDAEALVEQLTGKFP